MPKIYLLSLLLTTFSFANLFTITDKQGHVTQTRTLKHKENAFLNQKATEYSLQAIYDELHRAENLARRAQAAREHAQRIAQAKERAKKQGKHYKLTKEDKRQLLEDAKYYKGGKYVWGGTTPKGFDCSGYVQYLYKKHHINLPRTALAQSKQGISVDKEHMQKGDLLFFLTDKKRGIPVTHVGIYLGNNEFIHAASTKKGIIISPIDHGYYSKKFLFAKRVLNKNS